MDNLLLAADSYKASHHKQYPPQTTVVYSYFESRGGLFPQTVFFGLQYLLQRWLLGQVVTQAKIDEAYAIFAQHLPAADIFNRAGWQYILDKHEGRLPLRIKAVPEGTVVDTKNVLLTVENTDPACYWLPCYVETLLVQLWYPMTVATNSREYKKIIKAFLDATSDNPSVLPFKLVDFGCRGVSSMETAAIGGAAHLVNFSASDTVPALMMARKYYHAEMPGYSIPAAEHSTITSWGRDHEADAMLNMLEQFPTGSVAVVSDSYDVWNACKVLWGGQLKAHVIKRGENGGGTLLIRPDSGDPPTVVLQCMTLLGEAFGYSTNSKGFKVLPSCVRLIQGDGICLASTKAILQNLADAGWSAENVSFGSGGALLQKMDRDTQKCAFKCSYAEVNGECREVYKDPITDPGKMSKRGRLTLERRGDHWVTTVRGEGDPAKDELVTVFENGVMTKEYTFEEVRRNAEVMVDIPPNLPKRDLV